MILYFRKINLKIKFNDIKDFYKFDNKALSFKITIILNSIMKTKNK